MPVLTIARATRPGGIFRRNCRFWIVEGSQNRAQAAAPGVPPVVADGRERNQTLARRPDRRHLPVRPMTGADLLFGLSRSQPPERSRRLPDDPERPVRVALDEDDRRLGTPARDHDRVDPRPLRGQCEMG